MRANVNTLPASVAITVRILVGATEDLTVANLRPGQRSWWVQRTDGTDRPWLDTGGRYRGSEPCSFTLDLVPGGRYIVGVGASTRVRFVCPSVPCTMAVDPSSGTANVVSSAPTLTVVQGQDETPKADGYHIRNAPIGSEARGVTYATSADAFAALDRLVQGGSVSFGEISAGTVVVTRGWWPVASYPPPAPPVVEARPVSAALRAMADATPIVAPVVEPDDGGRTSAADFTWATRAETVSPVAVARITEDERYLSSLGLVMPPPVRTFGGVVNDIGRNNIARSHCEWSAEPRTVDTLDSIRTAVSFEQRADRTVTLGALRMQADGRLAYGQPLQGGGLYPEETAIRDLASLYPRTLPRSGDLLTVCPPEVRAAVWNDARGDERDADTVVLRTREAGDGHRRSAFAVVSPGYTACDADVVARWTETALRRMPGGTEARGEASYDPETTRLSVDAVWHSDHVVDFAAGDVFKTGVRITSADNATGAIRVGLVVWRNLCFNLIITSQTTANMARIVHRGDQASMIDRLTAGIAHVGRAAAPFLARWGHLRTVEVDSLIEAPSQSTALNLRAVFSAMAGVVDPTDDLPHLRPGALPEGVEFGGVDRDVLVESLLRSWNHEPGSTLADVVNAVTRLHAERVPVPVLRQAESNAGLLVQAWGA